MSVVLALCSAVAYGLSDFVGGLVARRTTAWSVALVAQLSAALSTTTFAWFAPGAPTARDFGWAVLAGVATGIGTAFLYRGLSSGRMSIVAPISGVGAAVLPVLAGVGAGERPPPLVWLGVAAAMPGIWLVSRAPDPAPASAGGVTARASAWADGVVDGVLAGVGFGVLFSALGQVRDGAGLWPLAAAQAASVPAVLALATGLGAPWRPRGPAWWALAAGPLGSIATGSFLLASQRGLLTVAGVVAALYPAVTVVLAMLVLRERLRRAQGVGLALCVAAIGLVATG